MSNHETKWREWWLQPYIEGTLKAAVDPSGYQFEIHVIEYAAFEEMRTNYEKKAQMYCDTLLELNRANAIIREQEKITPKSLSESMIENAELRARCEKAEADLAELKAGVECQMGLSVKYQHLLHEERALCDRLAFYLDGFVNAHFKGGPGNNFHATSKEALADYSKSREGENVSDYPEPDECETEWHECESCYGLGEVHNCGEDCCCCIEPHPNWICEHCKGEGGWQVRIA